jgi:hypothetical protein
MPSTLSQKARRFGNQVKRKKAPDPSSRAV